MWTHVPRTVSGCFAVLRQLRQIRKSVSTATFQTLVVALVMSRLDYGNSALIGLLTQLIRRLQLVQNAAAWLICKLQGLHWLRIPECIVYKMAVLTFKVILETTPQNLGPVVRVADLPGRQVLRSASTNRLVVPSLKLSTISSRAFSVAGPQLWNSLSEDITSVPSLLNFAKD